MNKKEKEIFLSMKIQELEDDIVFYTKTLSQKSYQKEVLEAELKTLKDEK